MVHTWFHTNSRIMEQTVKQIMFAIYSSILSYNL